ncbi:hypothetical protein BGZ81_003481 [Podila clonocystis]|nr:hypothetical protein BGZ81_003481 [Podila clonocystis]
MNNNNNVNNPAPTGSASGSVTDTLMGYVNVAKAKGQSAFETAKVIGHQVQEQINQASAQAKAQKGTGQAATHNASTGTQMPQMPQNHSTVNSGNVFGDLDKFNTQANQPASHSGYKSSQSGL